MQPTMCSRCGKNVAIVFITKIEAGQTKNEGLCLKCARELHIKPIDDVINKMGISDDDLDSLTGDLSSAMSGLESLMPVEEGDDSIEDDGKTATFPFLNRLFGGSNAGDNGGSNAEAPRRPEPKENGKAPKRKFLDSYCIDLTQRAREGKLDNMIGREEELERVIQILNRRQKNNPCLIGEPGVGKTAIAEGLAQRIAMGNVPYKLQDKQVFLLDLTALVAGTQFRGQFESRMKGLIEEIRKLGNIILVIDEVHNIVGAGDAEGSMNAANILKPALSRGEIQVIGATTFTEYRKHIEKDSALERRFQPVTVNEPSIEDSVKIIKGIAHYYEEHHGVRIPDEMCRQAVLLSERYITDRFLPDKAIDLIDEACSDVNLKDENINKRMMAQRDLENIRFEREGLMSAEAPKGMEMTDELLDQRYARIAQLRSKELQLEQQLKELDAKPVPELGMDNLARVIELWTKIPASSIREDELEHLAGLEGRLKEHIVGQDEAVAAVCAAIKRSRVGLKTHRKPVSFIFVGGTGVGKTELVKRLAADMFDSPEALIRLDMSEFMEKFSVSRIIGSPPGYVGYDEAGQLTEKIRRKPYSVVLFDEIEKAHPDVMNILLQILDDGRITDAQGRTVNFENTLIIMTSNAGSDKTENLMGFGKSAETAAQEKAMRALEDFLRPEFLARVSEIAVFNPLGEKALCEIAELCLSELQQALQQKSIVLQYKKGVPAYFAAACNGVKRGARDLRNNVRRELEDEIINAMIEHSEQTLQEVCAAVENKKLQLTYRFA